MQFAKRQKDLLFWLWLSSALGPASRDFRTLIELYENPYDLFHADENELERIPSIAGRTREKLANKDLTEATEILDACQRLGIGILSYEDQEYPNALREISTPPVLLYYKGVLPNFNTELSIGMVGTRKMSAYGLQSAYKISYELASVGVIVVSGMASGIDGVCAAAALAANGKTVAVLGCGLDLVYPPHHKQLSDVLSQKGLLLSEYPPATKPIHYHFPVRNRIISGLSQGTLVVEAGIGSGSLITAKDAILQGRKLFAVPANVGSKGAEGPNGLLRDGAVMVLDTEDVLRPFEYVYAKSLMSERLPKAKEKSAADLAYLESLGVIELKKRAEAPSPLQAVLQKEKPKAKATLQSREPSPKTAPQQASAHPRKEVEKKTVAEATLASLSPIQVAVMQAIPDDRAISADALGALGYPMGEVIAALTMLEILGLVQKLPGALYTKL